MLIRETGACPRRRVPDRSLLCELLHPNAVPEMAGIPLSVAPAVVPPGESRLPHRLRTATELYCILSGTGRMHAGAESVAVHPGRIVMIPQREPQFLDNCGTGDLSFLCIVYWRGVLMMKNGSADMAGYPIGLQNRPHGTKGRSGEDQETCRKRINSSHSHVHDRGYGFHEPAGV